MRDPSEQGATDTEVADALSLDAARARGDMVPPEAELTTDAGVPIRTDNPAGRPDAIGAGADISGAGDARGIGAAGSAAHRSAPAPEPGLEDAG